MIGQKALIDHIHAQIANETFPRFSVIVGRKGSGRKTLVKELFPNSVSVGISVDDIRKLIEGAYKAFGVTRVYLIADADKMSLQAQNALLKVAEEPPNNAYIIMTLEDEYSVLDTIRSRACIYKMECYLHSEIKTYVKTETNDSKAIEIVSRVCNTIGEAKTLIGYNPVEFFDFVQLVVDKVATVSLANALKISEKLALKDESGKYDLELFFMAFLSICSKSMADDVKDREWCLITSRALRNLQTVRGINKQMLFDSWLFDIREWDV